MDVDDAGLDVVTGPAPDHPSLRIEHDEHPWLRDQAATEIGVAFLRIDQRHGAVATAAKGVQGLLARDVEVTDPLGRALGVEAHQHDVAAVWVDLELPEHRRLAVRGGEFETGDEIAGWIVGDAGELLGALAAAA